MMENASLDRWTPERAWGWYNSKSWLLGCNFVPSSAINQLEMWQADTFNPGQIDHELALLANLGMTSMRVFLHDLLWVQDPKGFLSRIEQYLDISHRLKIGTMLVFFDSVWHPFPRLGKQPEPEPGVHNSGWVQSPGVAVLRNEKEWGRLEDYVSAVIEHFKNDERIDLWDIWNEPENTNFFSYAPRDIEQAKKASVVMPLLTKAFSWARRVNPSQPLTSGVWRMDQFKEGVTPDAMSQFQLGASDVISFHGYESLANTQPVAQKLQKLGRPLLCSEYLARGPGNTFQQILPYFHQEKIGAYNWGGVSGKSQTIFPWDSWQNPYMPEPPLWQHDIFRPDGSAYDPTETALIRSLANKS